MPSHSPSPLGLKRPHRSSDAEENENTRIRLAQDSDNDMQPGLLSDNPDQQDCGYVSSDLPDLTDSEVEEKQGGVAASSRLTQSKNPFNVYASVRKAENDYKINPDEDLSGPKEYIYQPSFVSARGVKNNMVKLNAEEKAVRRCITNAILAWWPNPNIDKEKSKRYLYGLTDECAFWFRILKPVFQLKVTEWINMRDKDMAQIAPALFKEIDNEVKNCTPFNSPLLLNFYSSFMDTVKIRGKNEPLSDHLTNVFEESEKLRIKIKEAHKEGDNCLKQAKWIGLDGSNKNNRKTQMKRHMVETQSLLNRGMTSGALKKNGDDALFLGSDWHRVCAPLELPEEKKPKMLSLIFWHKSGPDDKPSWENQFGAIVYNPDAINKAFCDRNSSILKTECQAIYRNMQTKVEIPRGIADQGIMIKHGGSHSTYNALNYPTIKVDKTSAKKPFLETVQRIQAQEQLKLDLKHETPAIQACSFAYMMGFLPHLAYEQYLAAESSNLINSLGRPNLSSFAAYGYSAGLHLDTDVCISHGWVFNRPKEVTRNESNFVYGDYRLIVELSNDAHWFWDASRDAHGTTSNNVAMCKPSSWKKSITDRPNAAQWAYVQTIPQAVARASVNALNQPQFNEW